MPISKFFLTKGTKKEAELNSDEKVGKVDQAIGLKEEPESKESTEPPSSTEKEEHDIKSSVSPFPQGVAENCQMKRNHEELSTDSKLTTDETNKLSDSPGRKKGKLKSAGDYKQPSVLSYFAKK